MSVAFETQKEVFVGTAGPTVYTTTQTVYLDADDVLVYEVDPTVSPATSLLLIGGGVDYTSSLVTPAALPSFLQIDVSPKYPGGLPASIELHVIRASTLIQNSTFISGDRFPATAVELALDKVILGAQDAKFQASKAVRAQDSDDLTLSLEIPLAEDRASMYLGFDASGNVVALAAPAGTTSASVWGAAWILLADSAAGRSTLELTRFDSGALGSRGTVGAYGVGAHWATDNDLWGWSDGATTWVNWYMFRQSDVASLPTGLANRVTLDTDNRVFKRDTGAVLEDIRAPLTRGAIGGLGTSRNATTTKLDVAVGEARCGNSTDRSIINGYLTSALTKQLNNTWAAGDDAGGRAAGTANGADKTWHVFLLVGTDGSTDIGFDDDPEAVNLLADAAVTAALGATVYYRRIRSLVEDGTGTGVIVLDHQQDDLFLLDVPVQDLALTQIVATTGQLQALSVPTGIQVEAEFSFYYQVASVTGGNTALLITSPDQNDQPALYSTMGTFYSLNLQSDHSQTLRVRTDTSGRIRWRSSSSGGVLNVSILTHGWRDTRGRDL